MKIAVCLKLVPATTADLRIAPDGQSIPMTGVETVPNPYDEYALEHALKLREIFPGSTIHAITVGGDDALKVLQHAFALGVDGGLHIKGAADARTAAHAVSEALKAALPDIVLCGRQAIDDDLWLFPGALGEWLGWPHASAVSAFVVAPDGKKAECRRRFGRGEQVLDVTLPAVISCDKSTLEPRAATLKGRLEGRKKQPDVKPLVGLGLPADHLAPLAPLVVQTNLAPPPQKVPGKIVTGDPASAAAELVRLLREEAKIV